MADCCDHLTAHLYVCIQGSSSIGMPCNFNEALIVRGQIAEKDNKDCTRIALEVATCISEYQANLWVMFLKCSAARTVRSLLFLPWSKVSCSQLSAVHAWLPDCHHGHSDSVGTSTVASRSGRLCTHKL